MRTTLITTLELRRDAEVRILTPVGARLLRDRIAGLERRLADLGPRIAGPEADPAAREEWERIEQEVVELTAAVDAADIRACDPAGFDGRVQPGMRVLVEAPDGLREWVRPVDPLEAWLDSERISTSSPLSRALMGARIGHRVWVAAPTGLWEATVIDIDPQPDAPSLP